MFLFFFAFSFLGKFFFFWGGGEKGNFAKSIGSDTKTMILCVCFNFVCCIVGKRVIKYGLT